MNPARPPCGRRRKPGCIDPVSSCSEREENHEGTTMPTLTRWLMQARDVLVHRTPYVVVAIVMAVLLYRWIRESRAKR